MRRELRGCRAIVTGASGGIGRAVAAACARAGMKVAAAARRVEKLQELVAEFPAGDILPIQADITQPEDRSRLITMTVDRWGGLDALFNIAGIGAWGHFATSNESINRQVLETNFFAPLELMRLAVPHLMLGTQPAIVNLTSMTGRRGMPAWPEYSASKAALVGFSEAMRGEMARFGIDVITIVPGLTNTGLGNSLLRREGRVHIPYDQGMQPDYVAEQTLRALQRNRTELVLGSEAKKILALNRWMPLLLNRLIAKRVAREYPPDK